MSGIYFKKAANFRELRDFVSEGYFLARERKLTTKPAPLLLYLLILHTLFLVFLNTPFLRNW